jgi:hypothetical protein
VDVEVGSILGRFKEIGNIETPAQIVGKSGVQHQFSFASTEGKNPSFVGDVIIGPGEKDETKVLSLFIKVYDIGAKRAILCVTPKLTNEAAKLARLYNILTVESPDAKLLPKMLQDLMERISKAN